MKLPTRPVSPAWFAPAMAVLAIGVGASLVLTNCHCRISDSARLGLVGVTVVAWLLDLAGIPWPRLAFVLVATIPMAFYIDAGSVALAPLFLCMTVAWVAYTAPRPVAIQALVIAYLGLVPAIVDRGGNPVPWLAWILGVGFSWLAATTLASQQRLLVELGIAQASLAGQAAAEERRRIARELHDVIAHSLAVTMLHLTGARHVLARDPERAADALAEAERLGRQSLADIRRIVGLLQTDRSSGTSAPLPSAADIPALVDEYAGAGLIVCLSVEGDTAHLSAAAGLGLYRIVQEALANVVKHAPGASAEVSLRVGESLVALRITDTGRRKGLPVITSEGGSGLGITGMRERASLLGGTLVARQEGKGWQVECTIPR